MYSQVMHVKNVATYLFPAIAAFQWKIHSDEKKSLRLFTTLWNKFSHSHLDPTILIGFQNDIWEITVISKHIPRFTLTRIYESLFIQTLKKIGKSWIDYNPSNFTQATLLYWKFFYVRTVAPHFPLVDPEYFDYPKYTLTDMQIRFKQEQDLQSFIRQHVPPHLKTFWTFILRAELKRSVNSRYHTISQSILKDPNPQSHHDSYHVWAHSFLQHKNYVTQIHQSFLHLQTKWDFDPSWKSWWTLFLQILLRNESFTYYHAMIDKIIENPNPQSHEQYQYWCSYYSLASIQ